MSKLDELKARVEGHTEGPWKAWNDAPAHRSAYVETTWAHEGDESVQITDWCFPADAELIAAAPKLLAALEAVEALAASWNANYMAHKAEEGGHVTDGAIDAKDDACWELRLAITEALA